MPRRGRVPKYCKTSHRIRAYEDRKRAEALAQAERRGTSRSQRLPGLDLDALDGAFHLGTEAVVAAARDVLQAAGHDPAPLVGVTTPVELSASGQSATHRLEGAMNHATRASRTKPSELRVSVQNLVEAIREGMAVRGLPEIDLDAAAAWWLVVPLNKALKEAEATLTTAPRSPRQLDAARTGLLAAAAAFTDPDEYERRSVSSGRANLSIAVPGPDGSLAQGLFETDSDGRRKTVRWAPDSNLLATSELAEMAGRPPGFRYHWEDKRVWEQLGHDMIVLSCGWRAFPGRLPPLLRRRASTALGGQLRSDLGGTSEWAVPARAIVRWLVGQGYVTVMAADSGGRPNPVSVDDLRAKHGVLMIR